jgi:Holliday junction resolvase RusA-like endonuclease
VSVDQVVGVDVDGVEFAVAGVPIPQGSKQAFVVKGKAVVTERGRARLGPWRGQVAAMASAFVEEPFAGPVYVELDFTFTRPKSHFRTGRFSHELREDVPAYVAGRPDVDKLARAVLDALTAVAYRDDGQVAELRVAKRYFVAAGVRVRITPLEPAS